MAAKQTDVEEVVEEKKKGGGKGLVIILLVVIVLLMVGMGALAFLMLKGDSKNSDSNSNEVHASAEHGRDGSAGADSFSPKEIPVKYKKFSAPSADSSPIYFVMDKFVVNFNGDGQAKFLAVDLQFMSYYPQLVSDSGEMEHLRPILKNDIQRLLRNQHFNDLSTAEGPDRLRAEILGVARQILEKHNIYPDLLQDVYMTRFVMQ